MNTRSMWMWVGLIVVIALLIWGYTRMNNPYGTPKQPATTNTPTNQTPAPTSTNTGSIIQTKTATGVGAYLADSNGNALYTYAGDTVGVSKCSGACLATWPAYKATATTSLPNNVTVITRADGSKQYAYKGMPLYTFVSDTVGKVTGDGVESFHIAKP